MRDISSAYWKRLQGDDQIAELIDLEAREKSWRWTTANQPLTATLSGDVITYTPFPGGTPSGIEESADLGVAVIDFVMSNTNDLFRDLTAGGDFAMANLRISRVFIDTPDLDRMYIYWGQIGDYVRDRQKIVGQARNLWQGLSTDWPYYSYEDKCVWRFGSTGCGYNTSSITISVTTIDVASSTTLSLLMNSGTLTGSYDSGRFDFGRCTITNGVNSGTVRTIRSHTGDLLTLSHPLPVNSLANIQIDIYPGCRKRLVEDCTSIWNNNQNFMGFPWIPVAEQAF